MELKRFDETKSVQESDEGSEAWAHQSDEARRRRLRWRSRRGLLENDLVLTRFLDEHEQALTDAQVTGYHLLLDLTDNELLDLILARKEPDPGLASPEVSHVLQMIRAV